LSSPVEAVAACRGLLGGKEIETTTAAAGEAMTSEPSRSGASRFTLRYPYEVRKEDEYFSDIPDVKVSKAMLQLAEHIVETKTGEFDPSEFEDSYEIAVVEMLKQKQSGKTVSRVTPKVAAAQTGNVIDLLKRSLELSRKDGKVKSPSIAPSLSKGKAPTKKRARA
jgi:DNA end-binding protein Ku